MIEGDIEREGWAAIRRAVKHLSQSLGQEVSLRSDYTHMHAGKREDLKAVWENVFEWEVEGGKEKWGDDGLFYFCKAFGSLGWWNETDGQQRRGLEAFIDMTEDEWDDECTKDMAR